MHTNYKNTPKLQVDVVAPRFMLSLFFKKHTKTIHFYCFVFYDFDVYEV